MFAGRKATIITATFRNHSDYGYLTTSKLPIAYNFTYKF